MTQKILFSLIFAAALGAFADPTLPVVDTILGGTCVFDAKPCVNAKAILKNDAGKVLQQQALTPEGFKFTDLDTKAKYTVIVQLTKLKKQTTAPNLSPGNMIHVSFDPAIPAAAAAAKKK